MVELSAQEPDINPANTAFWARPIREPKPDVSGETKFKTFGTALEQGTKFANEFIEKGIVTPIADTKAGELRDEFADTLNAARTNLIGDTLPTSLTGGTVDQPQGPMPSPVANVGDKTDLLQRAMDSGKLSETDYYGRVNAMAKQLRAQFPGYRDLVDERIAHVTGVHPANAYIKGQINDLNRMLAASQKNKDDFQGQFNHFIDQGYMTGQEAEAYKRMHDQGTLDVPKFLGVMADRAYRKAGIDQALKTNELLTSNSKVANQAATALVKSQADNQVQTAVEQEMIMTGDYKGQKISTMLQINPDSIPSEVWTQAAAQENAKIESIRAGLLKWANTPIKDAPYNGATPASFITGDKGVEQIINDALQPLQLRADKMGGKDLEFRKLAGDIVKAEGEDRMHYMAQHDPYIVSSAAMAHFVRENYGEYTFEQLQATAQGAFQTLPTELQARFTQAYLSGLTQPRAQAGGDIYEASKVIEDSKNIGIDNDQFYQGIIKGSDLITSKDTDPRARTNMIDFYFGPHSGTLTTVATHGAINAYGMLYTPLMSRSISKYNPDKYDQYELSAEQNARPLLTNSINSLKSLNAQNFPIKWDTETDHIEAANPDKRGTPQAGLDALKTINKVIDGLKSVYDQDPSKQSDVPTYVMARLIDMHIDPRNIQGVPEQIMNAYLHGRQGGQQEQTEKTQDRVPQQ